MKSFTTAGLLVLMARAISAVPHPAPAAKPEPFFFPENLLLPLELLLLRPTGSSSGPTHSATQTPLVFPGGFILKDTAPKLDARAGKSGTTFTSTCTSTSTFTDGATEYDEPLPISPASPTPLPFQPGGPLRNLTTVRLMEKPEEAAQATNLSTSLTYPVLTSTISVATTSSLSTPRTVSASPTSSHSSYSSFSTGFSAKGTGVAPALLPVPIINPLDPGSVVLGAVVTTINNLIQAPTAIEDIQAFINQIAGSLLQLHRRELAQREVLHQ